MVAVRSGSKHGTQLNHKPMMVMRWTNQEAPSISGSLRPAASSCFFRPSSCSNTNALSWHRGECAASIYAVYKGYGQSNGFSCGLKRLYRIFFFDLKAAVAAAAGPAPWLLGSHFCHSSSLWRRKYRNEMQRTVPLCFLQRARKKKRLLYRRLSAFDWLWQILSLMPSKSSVS